jgi:hypothetical protein
MTRDPQATWRDADPDDLAGMAVLRPGGRQAGCPPPEVVQASGAGVLPPDLEARVAAHVARCDACRTLREALEDPSVGGLTQVEQARVLQRVRSGVDRARRASRARLWRSSAAAAAVALAAVGFLLVWQARRLPAPAPAAGALDAPPRPAARTAFELVKPRLPSLGSSSAPGRSLDRTPEQAELARALAPYGGNDFREAAERLRAFVSRYPRSAPGYFYLGVSDLFLDRDASAVTSLEKAETLAKESDPSLGPRASWYVALAYRRTGQVDAARSRLKALCEGGGEFAPPACAGLQELAATYRLSGTVVDASGAPLAGVTVGEYLVRLEGDRAVLSRTPFAATTDGSGRYSVSGLPWSRGPRIILRAAKPGHFTGSAGTAISPEMSAAFRLMPWTHIALGDVVKGVLRPNDTTCGATAEPCRQFAVAVPRSGTLDVSIVSEEEKLDLWVELPTGDVYSRRSDGPPRVSARVFAGSTCQITIVNNAGVPAGFELTMRLR